MLNDMKQKFKQPRMTGHRRFKQNNGQCAISRTNDSEVIIDALTGDTTETLQHRQPIEHTLDSRWTPASFFQVTCIITTGIPNLKLNDHPLGLAQVIFDNCVVKVRTGFDLDNLLSLGRLGKVELINVTSHGWIVTDRSLLPCCIFNRWISGMKEAGK